MKQIYGKQTSENEYNKGQGMMRPQAGMSQDDILKQMQKDVQEKLVTIKSQAAAMKKQPPMYAEEPAFDVSKSREQIAKIKELAKKPVKGFSDIEVSIPLRSLIFPPDFQISIENFKALVPGLKEVAVPSLRPSKMGGGNSMDNFEFELPPLPAGNNYLEAKMTGTVKMKLPKEYEVIELSLKAPKNGNFELVSIEDFLVTVKVLRPDGFDFSHQALDATGKPLMVMPLSLEKTEYQMSLVMTTPWEKVPDEVKLPERKEIKFLSSGKPEKIILFKVKEWEEAAVKFEI